MNNSGFTSYDDYFDYEDDNAEAVVFLISPSGQLRNTCLYVMKREEAQRFCERPETCSNNPTRMWSYVFTTHKRDWRDNLDHFRKDDKRFDKLLNELNIKPIYRGGEMLEISTIVKTNNETKENIDQISLFDIA